MLPKVAVLIINNVHCILKSIKLSVFIYSFNSPKMFYTVNVIMDFLTYRLTNIWHNSVCLCLKLNKGDTGLESVLSLGGHKAPVVTVDWCSAVDCGTCLTASMDGKIKLSTLLAQKPWWEKVIPLSINAMIIFIEHLSLFFCQLLVVFWVKTTDPCLLLLIWLLFNFSVLNTWFKIDSSKIKSHHAIVM